MSITPSPSNTTECMLCFGVLVYGHCFPGGGSPVPEQISLRAVVDFKAFRLFPLTSALALSYLFLDRAGSGLL